MNGKEIRVLAKKAIRDSKETDRELMVSVAKVCLEETLDDTSRVFEEAKMLEKLENDGGEQ